MRISGSGCARNGMDALKHGSDLHHAENAIIVLHDALLAVARGLTTPAEVRDFFWHGASFDDAKFIGDLLTFEPSDPADGGDAS